MRAIRHSRTAFAALCGLSLLAAGCANYWVRAPRPNPATDYEQATLHAYFWGFVEDEQPAANCESNAIDEVRVRDNYGYALVTVLTLGIWMPLDVAWKCAKRPLEEGEI